MLLLKDFVVWIILLYEVMNRKKTTDSVEKLKKTCLHTASELCLPHPAFATFVFILLFPKLRACKKCELLSYILQFPELFTGFKLNNLSIYQHEKTQKILNMPSVA